MRAAQTPVSGFGKAWLLGWALAAAAMILGFGDAALKQQFAEPDNAMRLVGVRDFLAGQGWFDTVQQRLNPPEGVAMHWARWIDFAIAAPIWLLTPLLGATSAEIVVAFAWPLGLLAAFMWLVVAVSAKLGARAGMEKQAAWSGAILAALAFPAIEKFAPGSFDHHNVELVLVMGAVLALMRMRDWPPAGAIAGAALGVALATAAEGAPYVAAGLMAGGLMWLVRPDMHGRGLAWMGAGLIASAGAGFLALTPLSTWGAPVCDAMSTPFLGFAVVGGLIAIALGAGVPAVLSRTLAGRIGSAMALGGAGLVVLAVLFPACAGGGYSAVTPEMTALWMAQISETRTLLALADDNPALLPGVAGAATAGLVAAGFYLRAAWRHADGWILIAFLLAAWAVMAWQVRGAAFATAMAIPFGAWAVARARLAFTLKPNAMRAAGFAAAAAGSAAAAWASAGDFAQSRLAPAAALSAYEGRVSDAQGCASPAALDAMKAVPAMVLLNHFSIGAQVLQRTDHSVLAAAYHRNAGGTMAMINAMRSSPDSARTLVSNTRADHVLVCPSLPEGRFYMRNAMPGVAPEDTLAGRLQAGRPPDWLEPVDIGATPLKLYRIIR